MVSTGTMRAVPLSVALVGPPKVGKSTFLKSLQSDEARVGQNSVEIEVRDIANNIQLDLKFIKLASQNMIS